MVSRVSSHDKQINAKRPREHPHSLFPFPGIKVVKGRQERNRLFEDLAAVVGVVLAIVVDRLVPGPHGLDESPVLGVGGVELLEIVRLPVRGNVEDGGVVIAADDKGTLNDGVVVLAVDGSCAEEVLARALKTVVEATNEVVRHESHGKLLVVLVLHLPDTVFGEGDVLPKPLQGLSLVVVRVVALPLVQGE